MGDFVDLFNIVLFSDDVIILDFSVDDFYVEIMKLGWFDIKEDDYGWFISF